MYDGGCRAAVRREAVENCFEIVHRPEIHAHEVAVFPGDSVALGDFWNVLCDRGDEVQFPALGTYSYYRINWESERSRVDDRAIGNDAGLFQSPEAIRYRGRG